MCFLIFLRTRKPFDSNYCFLLTSYLLGCLLFLCVFLTRQSCITLSNFAIHTEFRYRIRYELIFNYQRSSEVFHKEFSGTLRNFKSCTSALGFSTTGYRQENLGAHHSITLSGWEGPSTKVPRANAIRSDGRKSIYEAPEPVKEVRTQAITG